MGKNTYKLEYQKIKGEWVTYLLFLGIGAIFINKFIGIGILFLNVIFTVVYKNNKDNNSSVYFNMALNFAKEGNVKEAKEYLNQSIKYNNLNREAYFFMGCILFDEEKYKEALEYLKRGHADEVNDPSLHYVLGKCYYNVDVFHKAIKYLENISYEGNCLFEKERMFTLGKSYAELERYEDAYNTLEKINFSLDDNKEDYLEYCYYFGISCFHTERLEESKTYFNCVKEIDNDYKYLSLYI
ncbi:Tetratricopeptide repeat-containing protein [Clostridium sp. DSM 8431]|uniref:tetratricopeptide repeat protein n=1 Tax=Clostridium sp. DSM 8431 TaxID=1761781 RepID=UPI0008DEC0EB|nr:tetratricopeptide repeat protein [Clostridium sp. DSM 8431]SFU32166.1 Tetratricopeptide repeat-containing protein [Clostridium sp. DSM 8431]